jgi:hypothetical protein
MARLVFVSYSQTDRETAFALVAALESAGLACWIAPRDVTPAAEWAAEIIEAISAAKVMVLIFSRDSNDSPQVRREVERAVHKKLSIVAFRLDEVLPERSLEYFLSSQHWLDAFPAPPASYFPAVIQALRRALEPRDPSASGVHAALGTALSSAPALTAPAAISESELRKLESDLARWLGPIAKLLVARAALRATGIEDLRRLLAAELGSERERSEFLRGSTKQPLR